MSTRDASRRAVSPRVLCIGETLVDMTQDATPASFTAHPGGSSLNVAVGLSRLGIDTALASPHAHDALGDLVRHFLNDEGVDLTFAPRVTAQSTLAMAMLIDGEPRYSFYPAALGPHPFINADGIYKAGFTAIHAGSIGLLEPAIYDLALTLFTGAQNCRTLDPNVRPSLVEDPDGFRARMFALAAHADIAKISTEDADFLAPGKTATDFATSLIDRGPRAVILTAAASGASVFTADGSVSTPTSGAVVRDTTGGGDSVMAATISRIVKEGIPTTLTEWHDVVAFGMRAAGLTCSRAGGAEAMPTLAELA